jgi:hypothetical protein
MLRNVIEKVRTMFVRTRTEVRVVEVPVVVEKRVEVPASPAPIPPTRREYWIVHPHKSSVLKWDSAVGDTEFAALNSISAFNGERVQFSNGGRYRAHTVDGRTVWTRIDRANRRGDGDRARHRARRLADERGGIVGE